MPSWTKRNSAGQPPTSSKTRAPHRHRALPDRGDVARARAVADAQPRHPVARRRAAVARGDAQLQQPELRVGGEAARDRARARRARRGCASSSRKNSSSPRACRDAGVAPGRDAAVLGRADAAHAVRQPGRLPAVADDDDVELDARAGAAASRAPPQLVRPAAHRQHDAAERHRSRLDARIATRWPSAVIAAIGTSATTSRACGVAADERVDDRRGQREQRGLDRHERAEEREDAERAPQPRAAPTRAAPRPPRCPSAGGLPGLRRATATSAVSVLIEQREHGDDQPERRVAADRVPAAVGADARARSAAASRSRSGRSGRGRRRPARTARASARPRRRSSRAGSGAGSAAPRRPRAARPGKLSTRRGEHADHDHQPR